MGCYWRVKQAALDCYPHWDGIPLHVVSVLMQLAENDRRERELKKELAEVLLDTDAQYKWHCGAAMLHRLRSQRNGK